MTKINEAKLIQKMETDQEEKAKKLIAEVLQQLKDLIGTSASFAELKAKIEMLSEIDSGMADQAKDLLNKLEMKMSQDNFNLSESDKLKKLEENIQGYIDGSQSISSLTSENMGHFQDMESYQPDRIEGSGSISVSI